MLGRMFIHIELQGGLGSTSLRPVIVARRASCSSGEAQCDQVTQASLHAACCKQRDAALPLTVVTAAEKASSDSAKSCTLGASMRSLGFGRPSTL
jgi:predicted metal-dependent phosphoesterase TrpH